MQKTVLYEVKEKEVLVGEYADFISMYSMKNITPIWNSDKAMLPLEAEVIRLPVKGFVNRQSKLCYYAFSPELQDIIDCLVEEGNKKWFEKGKVLGHNEGCINTLEDMKRRFKTMSLWERIKKAFKGDLQ